jgi:hypothetical protein
MRVRDRDRVGVLAHLQEEDVRHIELPQLVLAAELGTLPKDLLDHRVVLHVPIYPRLAQG